MPPKPRLKLLARVLPSAPALSRRPPPLGIGTCQLIQASSSPVPGRRVATPSPSRRTFSSSSAPEPLLPLPSSRWYADLRARLGKCIMFGCNHAQAHRAAGVLRALANEWRELSAGAEGFLTGGRRGLEGQQVVWGEMDSFGHVNNANYIRYAESARVNWIIHFAGVDPANGKRWRELMTPKGTGLIMKSIKAEYKFPMTYPDTISAYHKLRSKPTASSTSLVLDCIILSHRHKRVAARTEEDVVVYDYAAARKTAVPPFAFAAFRDVWRMQQDETRRARARIRELAGLVEGIEKETWDRSDAVEDMGTAAKGD
ncbi:thioesterase-like superfamily-domain-containing protein [Hypoxylon rubiginosum]|uniref:Thioesterase-like superfamily-domain-containing protein n=1 Tax=Hypoxylon rubiginosum TaxID=110542 RepID=A0ACC0DLU6_9PEZI|nr:thioesterase-like superfamily-domain-containing protein [Hypoxylon rubiginosum]